MLKLVCVESLMTSAFHHHTGLCVDLFSGLCLIQGGESLTLLEITGNKGTVQVNGKNYSKDATIPLTAGDEVVFSLSDKRSYVSFYRFCTFPFSLYNLLCVCTQVYVLYALDILLGLPTTY